MTNVCANNDLLIDLHKVDLFRNDKVNSTKNFLSASKKRFNRKQWRFEISKKNITFVLRFV